MDMFLQPTAAAEQAGFVDSGLGAAAAGFIRSGGICGGDVRGGGKAILRPVAGL